MNKSIFERGDNMAISEAKKRANRKWNEENYDRIQIVVKKGRKAEIQEAAKTKGMSVNGWINSLIDTAIDHAGDVSIIEAGEKIPQSDS